MQGTIYVKFLEPMNMKYQTFLSRELAKRCEKNPQYSLRAFAMALGIDAGTMSRYLNGKQIPSYKLSKRMLETLDITPEEQNEFLNSLPVGNGDKKTPPNRRDKPQDLSIEYYKVIGDWYHIALMELTFVEGFQSDSRWISSQLGISQTEANLAIERLHKLGLIQKKNGKIIKATERLFTHDRHLSTPALRRNQKQFLEKAIYSLENDPTDKRKITSMTVAINPQKLEIAMHMIDKFSQTLSRVLESGKRKTVYNLEVALYPVQKLAKEK